MKEEILNKLIKNYNINIPITINNMFSYPHIYFLKTKEDIFFLKIINKVYCKDINTLYKYLNNINCVEIPIKTINGDYYLKNNLEDMILYKYLNKCNNNPSSKWWAESLKKIHQINVNNNDFINYFNIVNEMNTLFFNANKYIDDNIKEKINSLINNTKGLNNNIKYVLSHSDPNASNVMIDSGEFKLVDTDGMKLLPKEFDIQRLLCNKVINSNNLNDVYIFWNEFINNYNNIDINLLKKIYVYDLIRVFCWLTIVSNDLKRVDRQRQLKELELYKKSILDDRHLKVLKKL